MKTKKDPRFVLLTENTYADGALATIFAPVKDSLKAYGNLLGDVAKLLGNDIGTLIGLTFGRLKDPATQRQYMAGWKRSRDSHLNNIASNTKALSEAWPDGKITSLMFAPGAFFTTQAVSGIGGITSPEFRKSLADFGLDKVPVLKMFVDTDEMSDSKFWREISNAIDDDDWEGSGERLSNKFKSILGAGGGGSNEQQLSLFDKINRIFLWSHHERSGGLIAEGDESSLEDVKKKFYQWLRKTINEEITQSSREELLASWKKSRDKITDDAAKTIELNAVLASTNDHKEFFNVLKKMSKMIGDESSLDVAKVEQSFTEMGKKIKEDEDAMSKLKKDIEESNEEPSEKLITDKVVSIVLNQFKAQYLPKLKEFLIDFYDDVYDDISGGLESKHVEMLKQDEVGKQLVDTIAAHKKKLDSALSKLKRP